MFKIHGAALVASVLLTVSTASFAIELPGVDDLMNSDALVSGLTGNLGLDAAMQKLGLGPDTISKLYSQLGSFVGTAGGDSLESKLMGLLGQEN